MRKLLIAILALALLAAACGSADDSTDAESDSGSDAEAVADGDSAAEPVTAEASSGEEGGGEEVFGEDLAADESSAEDGAEADEAAEDSAALEDSEASDDADAADDAEAPATTTATVPEREESPQAGLLTAAEIDDNLNFAFFNDYLDRTSDGFGQYLPRLDLRDRVTINAVGANGVGVPNARVEIDGGNGTTSIYTNATGTAYYFPSLSNSSDWDELAINVTGADAEGGDQFTLGAGDLADDGSVTLDLAADGTTPTALDIALVIDTTGSMGDELRYLTSEFTSIIGRVADDHPNVDMRFALVVYRDDGDDYITQVFDFTDDVDEMQRNLQDQDAAGGGDYPEAMDAAMSAAAGLSWRDGDVARVMVVSADAPPHDDRFEATLNATAVARDTGIRVYPLAASGVGDTAEYLMRIMAVTTGGRHLFLTDDSGIGAAHQEPKVQCYVVTRLDHLLIRVLRSELAGDRLEPIPEQLIRTVGDYDNGYCSDAG